MTRRDDLAERVTLRRAQHVPRAPVTIGLARISLARISLTVTGPVPTGKPAMVTVAHLVMVNGAHHGMVTAARRVTVTERAATETRVTATVAHRAKSSRPKNSCAWSCARFVLATMIPK